MGQSWGYLSTTPPAGIDPSAVKACYQFDGPTLGLTDRTGNGHDLSTSVAYGYGWVPMYEAFGCAGLMFAHADCYAKSADGPTLGCLGACTMEMVMSRYRMGAIDDTFNTYVAVGGPLEAEADNICFCIYGSDVRNTLCLLVEYGNGSNRSVANPDYLSVGLSGQLCYIAVTREADGMTYHLYVDGEYQCDIYVPNAPTGATNVHMGVGGLNSNTDTTLGLFQSVRWSHALMTAAQIEETYLDLHPGA